MPKQKFEFTGILRKITETQPFYIQGKVHLTRKLLFEEDVRYHPQRIAADIYDDVCHQLFLEGQTYHITFEIHMRGDSCINNIKLVDIHRVPPPQFGGVTSVLDRHSEAKVQDGHVPRISELPPMPRMRDCYQTFNVEKQPT